MTQKTTELSLEQIIASRILGELAKPKNMRVPLSEQTLTEQPQHDA